MENKIEITKLSSKGQIVIPQNIRVNLNLQDGNLFVVSTSNDTICLKKIEMPKIKTWKDATKPFREASKSSGFVKEDLDMLIAESKIK